MPTSPSGGYEGSSREVESDPDSPPRWTLTKPEYFFSEKITGQLRCDGISRGVVYFENEEEFEWLKNKLES